MAIWLTSVLTLLTSFFSSVQSLHIPLHGSINSGTGSRVYKRNTDVISVSGKPEHGYVIDIFLGTPAQKLSVVVDTGSSNFAVAANPELGPSTYFDSQSSSTYTEGEGSVQVEYVNGSWNGFFATDTVKLCLTCDGGKVDVALITAATDFFVDGDLWQGILGLAYSALVRPDEESATPVLDSLIDQHVLNKVFSLTLCGRTDQDSTDLHGSLEFGVKDIATGYTHTRITKEWYYQIELTDFKVGGSSIISDCYDLNNPLGIIDSGTTNIILPEKLYPEMLKIVDTFSKDRTKDMDIRMEVERFITRQGFLCVDGKTNLFNWFPDILVYVRFNGTHHFSINVPPEQYVRQTMESIVHQKDNQGTYCYMFGIESGKVGTILGAAFLERMTVLHDRLQGNIGFKLAGDNCSVTDLTFSKNIATPTQMEDPAPCLLPRRSSLSITVLAVSCSLVLLALVGAACYFRDRLPGPCFGGGDQGARYEYMLNSDEEEESELVADEIVQTELR